LVVGWKCVGREIGHFLVVARLAARADAAGRPSGIERIGGKRFALLNDLRNLLQKPIFWIGYRRLMRLCLPATSRAIIGNSRFTFSWTTTHEGPDTVTELRVL